ncbi:hypothetical protein P3S67_018640 [Capsicum chacoense]
MFHILLDGCHDVELQGVKVSAPQSSPNTDGIHLQSSSDVTILNSQIGTGDDCLSIGPGNSNLSIENIVCGPGHGISIGIYKSQTVRRAAFSKTQNGVRVKTWARPSNGFVRNVLFQHVVMNNVENPIIIDQNYCPGSGNCPEEGSGIRVSEITYQDVQGTSATEVAVKFDCSKINPCNGITLLDVKLSYKNQGVWSTTTN